MIFCTENEKIRYATAVCIEQIYFLRNLNLVMLIHFLTNLVQSYTSGSKTVSVINGKITPGESYTTLNEWMRRVGVDPLESPGGDIDIFFGNIGRYIVKACCEKSTRRNIFTTGNC